jgi:hypothetical protein
MYARDSWFVIIVLAAFSLAGDSQANNAVRFPAFEGTVVPITEPFSVRYDSFEAVETLQWHFDFDENGQQDSGDIVVKAHRHIQREGNALLQTMRLLDFDMSGTRISRSEKKLMSTLRLVVRSDTTGTATFSDVEGVDALPRGAHSEVTDADFAKWHVRALEVLPHHTVKTGSQLTRIRLAGPGGAASPFAGARSQSFVAQGFGFLGNTKVLVANVLADETIDLDPETQGSLTVGGYILYDAATMAVLKTDVLAMINATSSVGGRLSITLRARGDASLKP